MRVIEYIKEGICVLESSERMYKTRDESLKVRVVDDNIGKGDIYVNDKKIVHFTFSGAGIETVNIESSEELVGCFLELVKDLVNLNGEGGVESSGGIGGEIGDEIENKEEEGGGFGGEVGGEVGGEKVEKSAGVNEKDLKKIGDLI